MNAVTYGGELDRISLAREIEEFLYAEAEILDERRLEEWLQLLTEDVRYWMPLRKNVKFGEEGRENTREMRDTSTGVLSAFSASFSL